MSEPQDERRTQHGPRRPPDAPPRLRVSVAWTDEARAALEAGGKYLQASEAARDRRSWGAALRRAARECVAKVPPRGAAVEWARRHSGTEWSVDATFVSDEEMRELNARYRSKNRPTDVLSFAQAEAAPPGDDGAGFEGLDSEGADFAEADVPPWPGAEEVAEEATLGDLVIAVETARRQAAERAHSEAVEVLFLSIHGTLHLLGYDHQTSSQRRVMWREQEALFERLRGKVEPETEPAEGAAEAPAST